MARSRKHDIIANIHTVLAMIGIKVTDKMQVHWIAAVLTMGFIILLVLQVITLINVRHNFITFSECFSDLCFTIMALFKLFILRSNSDTWCFIFQQINKLEEAELSNESETEGGNFKFSEHIQAYSVKFDRLKKILTRLFGVYMFMYAFPPLLVKYGLSKLTQDGSDLPHILNIWSPLSNAHFVGYLVNISLECIGVFYNGMTHLVFDLTSNGVMMFISGQFSLIRHYSEQIGCRERICPSKEQDDLAHRQIILSHQIHVLIKQLTSKLRELLRNLLGVYLLMCTVKLGFIAVKANSISSITEYASMISYMVASLMQLFQYCYYSDEILNESAIGMGGGPYGAAYWSLSSRIRRELMILAMGMSRSCQLYAGPFVPVTLLTFVQIIRTAYSYYAIIRTKG